MESGTDRHRLARQRIIGEGDIGDPLRQIAKDHPNVVIGSYPKFDGARYSTEIVIRSRDEAAIETAAKAVEAMLAGIEPR